MIFLAADYADGKLSAASLTNGFDSFRAVPGAPVDAARGRGLTPAMRIHDLITRKLTETFRPVSLRIVDESHQHEGHAGHRPGGESHFRVYIVAQAFVGKSRLERHRLVNAALAAEFAAGVHALAIHASAPGEATR